MHIVATVTLAVALVLLLIRGFLRVARELLSRSICEVPSRADEVSFRQIERESGRRQPAMVEFGGDSIESRILTKQSRSGKPGEHHVTA
jgi:hypothetical protein